MTDIYVRFLDEHSDECIQQVNQLFLAKKEELKEELLDMIKICASPLPPHYEWEPDPCDPPWDHSGRLAECGTVSPELTITEFLDNEYTGPFRKRATFCSGCGWHYETWGDEISGDTLNLGHEVMLEGIRVMLEKAFGQKITEDELHAVEEERSFDDIFDECPASDFFSATGAAEFAGIADLTLSDLLFREKPHMIQ